MTEHEKFSLKLVFNSFTMKDPYPEITKRELIGINKNTYQKCDPSPHQAWLDGFNFAKDLILKELNRI